MRRCGDGDCVRGCGGVEGLVRLADAWHTRAMADDVVSHAFSHGFHPEHAERLAAYWAEALDGGSRHPSLVVGRTDQRTVTGSSCGAPPPVLLGWASRMV